MTRPRLFVTVTLLGLLPAIFFLPKNLARIYSFTNTTNNFYAGDSINSIKGILLPLGMYGLGNLPPYSSASSFPMNEVSIAIFLYLLIFIAGTSRFVKDLCRPRKDSRFSLRYRIFVFSNLIIQWLFALLYAQSQNYTYAKAGYYAFPIVLFALGLFLLSFHRFLITPIVFLFSLTLIPITVTFSQYIVQSGERSAIADSAVAKTLQSIPRNAQVIYFPRQFSSAYIAIRETYLWQTKTTMIQGANAKEGTEIKIFSKPVYIVQESDEGIDVERYSCSSQLCHNQVIKTARPGSPNLLHDLNRNSLVVTLKK